jgi:hypothetical protein
MMSDNDEVTINCPLCGQAHVYPLKIERSMSLGMATPDQPSKRRRSFLRLFTCPIKSARFEATLTLSDTALNRIDDVDVGPPDDVT